MTKSARNLTRLAVFVLLVIAVLIYRNWWNGRPNRPRRGQLAMQPFGPPIPVEEVDTPQPTCIKNFQFIRAAMTDWYRIHDERYPWNVSTNDGGIRELCSVDSNGFAINPALSFQLLTNKGDLLSPLYSPSVLICPQDHTRVAALTFDTLKAENVTYRLHVGTNFGSSGPMRVRLLCPIDGNILDANGTIFPGKKHAARE